MDLVERQVEFQVKAGPRGGLAEVRLKAEKVVPGGETPAGQRHDGRFQPEPRGERRALLVQRADAQPEGKATGLRFTSAVNTHGLFTVHANLIDEHVGQLSPRLMADVDAALQESLGL